MKYIILCLSVTTLMISNIAYAAPFQQCQKVAEKLNAMVGDYSGDGKSPWTLQQLTQMLGKGSQNPANITSYSWPVSGGSYSVSVQNNHVATTNGHMPDALKKLNTKNKFIFIPTYEQTVSVLGKAQSMHVTKIMRHTWSCGGTSITIDVTDNGTMTEYSGSYCQHGNNCSSFASSFF